MNMPQIECAHPSSVIERNEIASVLRLQSTHREQKTISFQMCTRFLGTDRETSRAIQSSCLSLISPASHRVSITEFQELMFRPTCETLLWVIIKLKNASFVAQCIVGVCHAAAGERLGWTGSLSISTSIGTGQCGIVRVGRVLCAAPLPLGLAAIPLCIS